MSLRSVAVEPTELLDLSWERLFGNPNPVELEIGTGKAGFLLRRAQSHPDRNFFGIEWASKYLRFAVDRMQRWGVSNVRLVRMDAAYFIEALCPRGSLSALHVYHPDPWPKRRHHKRRLFQRPFVDAAVACLEPGARWAVQTDHADYFEHIRQVLHGHPELEEVPFEDPESGAVPMRVDSNYEIKYRRAGRPVYRIAVRRR